MPYSIPEFDVFKPDAKFNSEPDRTILFEQYKLLVDSTHKSEERRKDSNSVFITLNSVFMSSLGYSDRLTQINLKNFPFFLMFVIIGFTLSIAWIKIIHTYKKINYVNYLLLCAFEKHLPSSVFSTRSEIIAEYSNESQESAKNNLVLERETTMPITFIFIYSAYTLAGFGILISNMLHS